MKTLIIALLFSINITGNDCKDLNQIRSLFEANIQEKKELISMIEVCEQSNCHKVIPYYAVAIMKKAEHAWNPIKKMDYFNEGKTILENFIKEHPENIEGRYVRWLTQKNAPKFLGYTTNLEEDYKFIQENITKSDIEKSYQKVMIHHIEKLNNE